MLPPQSKCCGGLGRTVAQKCFWSYSASVSENKRPNKQAAVPGTRSNPLTLCCLRHTSGFGEATAAPYPTRERPLLVTHVHTHTHSPMRTSYSFPPLSSHKGQIFLTHIIFLPPLLIQRGEGSTVSFKSSLSAAFPPHSRHGNSGACVLEHVCVETQDVVGYCMLAQPALQTLGLEFGGFYK